MPTEGKPRVKNSTDHVLVFRLCTCCVPWLIVCLPHHTDHHNEQRGPGAVRLLSLFKEPQAIVQYQGFDDIARTCTRFFFAHHLRLVHRQHGVQTDLRPSGPALDSIIRNSHIPGLLSKRFMRCSRLRLLS